VSTDSAGTIKSESDYYPWGGELQFVNNDSNHYKFTGKERDGETQLDYFGARYYSNGLGRFTSSDWSATPVPVPYATFDDPQTLNQYSYVRNIPTVKADPDGHDGGAAVLDKAVEYVEDGLAKLVDGAEVAGPAISGSAILTGVAIVAVAAHIFAPSVGQSDADERAQIEQAKQERMKQNGGVDPQETSPPAAAGGNKKGGGRNEQKVNQDRKQSAGDKLKDLKKERDQLKSKPNKTPEDKAKLQKVEKAINREIDRQKKSENHSKKDKGAQR